VAFFPPLVRYFLIAAGSRFAIRPAQNISLAQCSEIPYA
jgi:hypothetical protein